MSIGPFTIPELKLNSAGIARQYFTLADISKSLALKLSRPVKPHVVNRINK